MLRRDLYTKTSRSDINGHQIQLLHSLWKKWSPKSLSDWLEVTELVNSRAKISIQVTRTSGFQLGTIQQIFGNVKRHFCLSYWESATDAEMLLNVYQCIGQLLTIIIWSKILTVLRFRNPDLELHCHIYVIDFYLIQAFWKEK